MSENETVLVETLTFRQVCLCGGDIGTVSWTYERHLIQVILARVCKWVHVSYKIRIYICTKY